jgi:hypothetical protein
MLQWPAAGPLRRWALLTCELRAMRGVLGAVRPCVTPGVPWRHSAGNRDAWAGVLDRRPGAAPSRLRRVRGGRRKDVVG